MIPNTLEEWSLEIINDIIKKGQHEGDRFDFKKDLPD